MVSIFLLSLNNNNKKKNQVPNSVRNVTELTTYSLFNHSSYYYSCSPIAFFSYCIASVSFNCPVPRGLDQRSAWPAVIGIGWPGKSRSVKQQQHFPHALSWSTLSMIDKIWAKFSIRHWPIKDAEVCHVKLRKMGKTSGSFHFSRLFSFSSC